MPHSGINTHELLESSWPGVGWGWGVHGFGLGGACA